MSKQIIVGSIVRYVADGAINESVVRKVSADGRYIYIDYFEGENMISRKEQPILVTDVILIDIE